MAARMMDLVSESFGLGFFEDLLGTSILKGCLDRVSARFKRKAGRKDNFRG